MASAIAAIAGDLLHSPNLQVENPMAANLQYQQAQAAKAEADERAQLTQEQQLKNQEMQQQMASQQAIQRAYVQANGNFQAAMPLALQAGARPADVMALQQKDIEQRKSLADLDTVTLTNHDKHTKDALNAVAPLLQLPDDQAAQQWAPTVTALLKGHDLNPDDLTKAGVDPAVYPGRDHLQLLVSTLNGYQQGITNEQKNREIAAQEASSGATVAEKQTETQQKQRALDASALATAAKQGPAAYQSALEALPYGRAEFEGVTDPTQITRLGMTPEEQVKADQAAAQLAATTKHNQVMEGQGAGRLNVERQRLALETGMMGGGGAAAGGGGGTPQAKLTGDSYLATLPPGMAAQVKAISEGRATMPAMSRNLLSGQIRNAVFQYDPDYSDQRAQIRKAFTTGADGRNIGALNTATVHLDQLSQAADALKNGSFQPGNSAYNYFSSMLGAPAPTNFSSLKAAVSGELASALKGNATDAEIATMNKNISDAQSPDQLHGAVDTNLHILAAKLGTYQQRYAQQIPGDKVWSPVLPSAKAVYQQHGIDVSGAPSTKTGSTSGFKAGDTRVVNGKTYVRDDKGVWTAQ
jgi:hypothetical protein